MKVFIDERPEFAESTLYVYDEINTYHIEGDTIMATKRSLDAMPEQPKPFLKAPSHFIYPLAQALASYLESKGGVNSDQVNKGKIEVLNNEVHWMRTLIEKQLK